MFGKRNPENDNGNNINMSIQMGKENEIKLTKNESVESQGRSGNAKLLLWSVTNEKKYMAEYKMEGILKQNKELLCKSEDKQCPFYSDPSYDILFNSNKIILSPGQQLTNIS